MAILLGVDTGGTYTDAVLLADEERVLASAKALTTRDDLAIGIGKAVAAVLAESGVSPGDIAMASLSTTLATNALVEGQGGRVALVAIGFSEADLGRQGLSDALRGDPVIRIAGGHSHAGQPVAPLDVAALSAALVELGDTVSGFAVAAQFATRNPGHEIEARDLIQASSGRPVSCSHDLSARLNGPKRAMTAVLNARLIGMIDHLIDAAEGRLHDLGIDAPLMVVRGDGALVSAAMARLKPIETILSGPAASLVGARWLTGQKDALVSDIGGTTTDVGLLRNGRPEIDPQGASVGGFRTMVEAVAMRTTGLGGDSEVRMIATGLEGALDLGPRRVMPVSLCAVDWPDLVHASLDRQLSSDRSGEFDGRFAMAMRGRDRIAAGLPAREEKLLAQLAGGAVEMSSVAASRMDHAALERLVARGLVMLAGVTPSDAAHVLNRQTGWDRAAADKALALLARQKTGAGKALAASASELAGMIIDRLVYQTSEAILTAALAEDDGDFGGLPAEDLACHPLMLAGLNRHRGLVALEARLNLPVVGLGASAPTYYAAVGERLGTEMILPDHAGVANALGAVVGRVTIRLEGSVTMPSAGRFRVHCEAGPQDFPDEAGALAALEADLSARAEAAAREAGAESVRVTAEREVRRSKVEGKEMFVEALIRVSASGRPRFATG
ncbi:MAG: hydantoinase/oxoprolinase family protein [Rhodobacteraceae bacterium]|nr:hydantoinase/oxoprolinase family protein [Paracoccaceae bacterium]